MRQILIGLTLSLGIGQAFAAPPAFNLNPVSPLPYQYTPLSPGQHGLSLGTATSLTVPSGALYATVCASTATVYYTTDGTTTPSNGVGQPLASGVCVALSGPLVIGNFKAFSNTGTIDVEYFR